MKGYLFTKPRTTALARVFATPVLLACTGVASFVPQPASAEALPVVSSKDGTLLPVRVDRQSGQILITLPPPDADEVSGRFLYATMLKSGLGSAQARLDRGLIDNAEGFGVTHIIAFRRLGAKVAIQYENPRFRATGSDANVARGAAQSFPVSTVGMANIVSTAADGAITIDIAPFLASDTMNIGPALGADAKGWKLDPALSAADPSAVKDFPDNIELEAVQTYSNETPGEIVREIGSDPRHISFTVHHSLVRLPGPGFTVRRFDIRSGTNSTQVYDYGTPLGEDVQYGMANHFRLEKVDPTAAQSRVKKPIIYYIDNTMPEPIRDAVAKGVAWWNQAFEAAGYIDAFQVKILPPGADPADVRYNMVNWTDRLTRGWSYGTGVIDPRTGEIIKGNVVLGALRVRQDVVLFESLLGTAGDNTGGPNDPVRIALARMSQLGAHEVGHSLGFVHNFEGSTQDRTSVMDYPFARIAIKNGKLDLGDAYAQNIGSWDKYTVNWLYGQPAPGVDPDTAARAKADAMVKSGMKFMTDIDGRSADLAVPGDNMWTDGADEAPDLQKIMEVRRIALSHFGPGMLRKGEPLADLKRKFVPLWLLHRYEIDAVGKLVGGMNYTYALAGDGTAPPSPVDATRQEAALSAMLDTLSEKELTVPPALLPLLSSGYNGNADVQYDGEIFKTAGASTFDPLVAADVAAQITLETLLAPMRLARIYNQHHADARLPGLEEVLDKLVAATVDVRTDAVGRRVAYRTIMMLAAAARNEKTPGDVAVIIRDRLKTVTSSLGKVTGQGADARWARGTAAILADPQLLQRTLDTAYVPPIPPGMPI